MSFLSTGSTSHIPPSTEDMNAASAPEESFGVMQISVISSLALVLAIVIIVAFFILIKKSNKQRKETEQNRSIENDVHSIEVPSRK